MRILVTGGAGYIGSHVARLLRRLGHEPVIYDNFSTGHSFLVEGFECIAGDISHRATLALALRGKDAVMHFAALSTVAESVQNPQKYFENNVRSGLTLLDAVMEARTKYFIFSSTCAVYGLPRQIPIPEETPRHPVNPYGSTKLALELALEAYSAAYGLCSVSLRYFNAAGADESSEIGEAHRPETHLIPLALATAAGQRPHMNVYGLDHATPDGTCIRDFIHVNDLAEAHVRSLDYLVAGGPSGAFNIGTGAGRSVLEVLAAVERITGRPLARRHCPRRLGDPAVLVADARRAARELQWQPSRSLEDMVTTAWKWMQRPAQSPSSSIAFAARP